VITEKPSVARDLARVLGARGKQDGFLEGEGLRLTWCIGHLVELEDPAHYDPAWRRWSLDTLPMVPAPFALRLRKGIEDRWAVVRKLLRDRGVDEVINACDAGREGELIFRYVYELAECRHPVRRLWVSSLTDEAIRDAWSRLRPGGELDALADAARCRSEADWLVGMNATRALTCLANSGGGDQLLSVGRVQTPTLAMVVDRDRAIEAFVPEPFWQVRATLSAEREQRTWRWEGTWFRAGEDERERPTEDEAPRAERLADEITAQAIARAAKGRTGRVTTADRKRTREQPPLLYDLTSLQRRANERYGMSAQVTLAVAQALYEKHKLITYPRTDARHITPDQVAELPRIVRGLAAMAVYKPFADAILAAPIRPGKRVVDAAEVGDHHAILPTGRTPEIDRLTDDERRLYDLVARRLLAALSGDAVFDVTTLVVSVGEGEPLELPEGISAPLRFRARGRVCREVGWRAVDPPGKSNDIDLPPVERDDPAHVDDTQVLGGQTRPPRPYTDATLLRAMETAGRQLEDSQLARAMRNAGLGTPATRADILQTLLDRKYLERDKRDLRSTFRGRSLVDAIPVLELKNAELTGRWEARLAAVADAQETRPAFMADVARHVTHIVASIAASPPPLVEARATPEGVVLGACPVCGKPVREGRAAFSCETGRACAFVVFKLVAKRKVSPRMIKQLLTEGRTPVLKGFVSKAGKPFEAGLMLEEGKVAFYFENAAPRPKVEPPVAPQSPVGLACRRCQTGHIVRGKQAWGCDQWREGCRFVLPFEVLGRMLSESDAAALIAVGRTAALRFDAEGRVVPAVGP
jgi:DNA topoisomerase-3